MSEPDETSSPGQSKRPRAPTITIDTSAVSSSADPSQQGSDAVPLQPIQPIPNTQSAIQGDSEAGSSEWASSTVAPTSGASHRSQASKGSIPELRAAESFESRDSRPTSPHNFSSPVSRLGPTQGFLSVPGTRSRQNSVDSDEASRSSGTYVGDASALSGAKSDGDRKEPAAVGSNKDIMQDREALKPDPGTEADFFVDDNKFAFTPGILNKLINPKSLSAFYAVGGLAGLEKGLRTDRNAGLSVDETTLDGKVSFESVVPDASRLDLPTKPPLDKTTTTGAHREKDGGFADRRRIFKDNRLPEKKGKSLLQLMWITYNDKVLILLSIAALVSLGVGLYQTFGMTHPEGQPAVEWIEGVAIIVAIVIVVLVGSLNDYQKERQFVKLNKKKQDRIVNVIRSGKSQEISVFDILVGDVMLLHAGDMVPCDGIFIEGHSLKCDESSATGESDLMRKTPADDVYAAIENGEEVRKLDPFILSGAQVTEGVGTFVVTSVGVNSSHGKIMMSLREDQEATPLQSKLNILAEYIAKLGGAAGLLLFVVLFIKFLVGLKGSELSPAEKGQQFLGIFIVTVTIIVVAVPEGLPLAVTLALAFATTRMLKDNNLVRHLRACEVMGNATAICSDKTGTLTQNKMLVVAGAVGTSSRFSGHADGMEGQETSQPATSGAVDDVGAQEAVKSLDQEVKDLLIQSIAINSTAFEGEVDNQASFIGSKTETALLTFARTFLAMGPVGELRSNVKTVQVVPFDSKRKCSGVVMVLENGKYRLIVKGASEIMLENCTEVISDPTRGVSGVAMSSEQRQMLSDLITSYAERSLRTIGLVYRDFESWPPQQARRAEGAPHEALFDDVFKNMTLLTIVGIQDPLRPGVREAVETCQKAGVTVRMVTGDNVITARAIAKDCGIYTGGEVIEGPAFRKLTTKEKDRIIPRLQVLARSSPEDKRILVKRLKELGETVAVTGDGTNDAPALKGADVGFSMGIAGTEVAKEASAIILMDDNFASIVKAMMWGRAVNDAVKKFLQFQVTVNITAVLLTFITATSSSSESSILTAVQLLWVNLIMDTLAALALATDPPTPSILNRKPELKTAPLISITMWKMIIGEAIYQLAVTLFLYYAAANVWAYEPYEVNNLQTFVFNTFVWMQIFNQWNNRRLDNKFNIFEGMFRNYFFIGVNLVMVGGQVMIIYVGGRAFNVVGLTGEQWGYSILFGFLSIPMGVIIRLIPDELLLSILPKSLFKPSKKGPEVTIEDEEQGFSFPQPLKDVRDELAWLKRMKGGRVNNLRFAMHDPKSVFTRSRSGSRSRSNSIPQTPVEPDQNNSFEAPRTPESRKRGRGGNRSRSNSALGATAVMAGIIAGSVAGWSPIERGHGEEDSLKFSRERGKSDVSSRDGQEGSSQGNNGDDLGPPPPAYGSTLQPPASPERKR